MAVKLPVNFRVAFTGGSSGAKVGPVAVSALLESNDNTFKVTE
jgi:hypothetical protein